MDAPGLRERKKQRTRDALVDAACDLFAARGFTETTVEQIAAAVDVSPRTFFRYFSSKDDVAVALVDQQLTDVVAALAARPADESVITALRRAVIGVLQTQEHESVDRSRQERRRDVRALLVTSPPLVGAALQLAAGRVGEVGKLLGERMGVDPARDGRPYLVAAIVLCAVQTAVDAWQVDRPDAHLVDLVDEAFDLLAPGLDHPAGGPALP